MAIRYLVVEDGKEHLPVTDEDGKPNHHLMGAAWAALHGGYRGNKYEGPKKEEAIAKLKKMYEEQGIEVPAERAEADAAPRCRNRGRLQAAATPERMAAQQRGPTMEVQCYSTAVIEAENEAGLPKEIMFAPGGVHTIGAKHPATGKPIRVTVNVKPDAVLSIQATREIYADNSENYKPMADKNHERKEATFWAGPVRWANGFRQGSARAGDLRTTAESGEGKDGLVIGCETWTKLGADSILGKVFRCFSPELILDADRKRLKEVGGVLQFEKGARGSAENPAEIVGHAREAVGTLTNDPAFTDILPIWAERGEVCGQETGAQQGAEQDVRGRETGAQQEGAEQMAAQQHGPTEEEETNGGQPPKLNKESPMSDKKEDTAVDAAAVTAIQAEKAKLEQSLADAQKEAEALRERVKAADRVRYATAIQAAVGRGAIAPQMKVKRTVDGKEAEVLYTDFLAAQCEANPDTLLVIEQMPAAGGALALQQRVVKKDGRDTAPAGAGLDASGLILCERPSLEEAVRGYLSAQAEARRADKQGTKWELIDNLRRQAGQIYEKHIRKAYLDLGHVPVQAEWAEGIDFGVAIQGANSLGTLAATNIVAQEVLVLLRKLLFPFLRLSFDLSSKGAVFLQTINTRTRAVPVVNHRQQTDTTYSDSDTVTYDASVQLSSWPYVQNTIVSGIIASTTRDIWKEVMEPILYAVAEDMFKTWTGIMTVANFDKTPILNRQGYTLGSAPNRLTLVGIDNDLDTLLNPEQGREVLMATDAYNSLRNDVTLVMYFNAGPESDARRTGDLGERENLYVHKTQEFNSRTDGVRGFALTPSATVVATRIPTQVEKDLNIAYPGQRDVITEPDTGLSLLVTKWMQPDGSAGSIRAEALIGANVAQANAGLILN